MNKAKLVQNIEDFKEKWNKMLKERRDGLDKRNQHENSVSK